VSKDIVEALNNQLNNELYSAYLYLRMSAYFKSNNLSGFAKWFKLHAKEETMHAMKIYDFIIDRNWEINLLPIKAPEVSWNSAIEIFTASLKHEQKITKMINKLAKLTMDHNDYATTIFLQWFITEQVEEEVIFGEILDKVKLTNEIPFALVFLDAELEKNHKS
jgi:ferritin